jgi:hypothetical protein
MPFWARRFPQEEKIESVRIKYFIATRNGIGIFSSQHFVLSTGLGDAGKIA